VKPSEHGTPTVS